MVIGSLFSRRVVIPASLIALAFILLRLPLVADDQIIKTDGSSVSGRVVGVSGGQVMFESKSSTGSIVKLPYYLTDIKTVKMDAPDAVAKAEAPGVAPEQVIAAIDPAVKQFAGLPSDWVVQAMAALADAYAANGKPDKALTVYNQITQLYKGSSYEIVAKAGEAKLSLQAGKIPEALAAVQPIIDKANQDIAPSPTDAPLYANAFLVYGQALEAEKKPQQALEAYLTVKTMFYQNPTLADQADQFAKDLRSKNPDLGVE
jgi:tetratricopeptide (TPR) repeat protein